MHINKAYVRAKINTFYMLKYSLRGSNTNQEIEKTRY